MNLHLHDIKAFIFGRYGGLLIILLVLMILQPAIDTELGKYLLEALFIVVLFAGLRTAGTKKSLFRFEIILLMVSFMLNIAGIISSNEELFFLGIACRTLFLCLVAVTILLDLFHRKTVNRDSLAGAVCVYLLIALIWGYLFLLIELLVPGSFSFTQGNDRMQLWISREFFPFLYFSLVTMTTVGYGDMSPVTAEAQTFATLEALAGQIYLTILVARLVGMYLLHQQDNRK